MPIYVIIIIAIVAIIATYCFILYNGLVKINNKVKEAFSTMDVYLKKRWDLIPNLVETVKGYAKHENDTFEEIIKLRNDKYDSMSDRAKLKTNEQVSDKINKVMLLAESYPELKASDNFKNLSNQLTQLENDIANSRKYYNGTVRIFNTKIEVFPNNIVAKIFGYKTKDMFEASKDERENVKIEFER